MIGKKDNKDTDKQKDPEWQKAYHSLTRYLGGRDHSELELRTKLSQKYSTEITDEMIQIAYDNNWMCDPQELAERTANRLAEKGKGFVYVDRYLREKGLPPVQQNPEKEKTIARSIVKNKFGNTIDLSYSEKAKVIRFLASRGFNQEIANSIAFDKDD